MFLLMFSSLASEMVVKSGVGCESYVVFRGSSGESKVLPVLVVLVVV